MFVYQVQEYVTWSVGVQEWLNWFYCLTKLEKSHIQTFFRVSFMDIAFEKFICCLLHHAFFDSCSCSTDLRGVFFFHTRHLIAFLLANKTRNFVLVHFIFNEGCNFLLKVCKTTAFNVYRALMLLLNFCLILVSSSQHDDVT